eukprot:SM000105S13889  [mRNA]  locus=s105:308156:308575:+ [translate_table: standard]
MRAPSGSDRLDAPWRGVEEVEVEHVTDTQRLELQHNAGKVAACNLRHSLICERLKCVLGVESEALARALASRTPAAPHNQAAPS